MRGLGQIRTTAGNACRAGLHRLFAPMRDDDLSGLDVFARYPAYHRHLILTRMGWDHDAGHHAWHERDYPYCAGCTIEAREHLGIPPRLKHHHSPARRYFERRYRVRVHAIPATWGIVPADKDDHGDGAAHA